MITPQEPRTPLYDWHRAHGGRMVDFAGWQMPVQYTTIVEEHHAVRRGVGLFDVSHMGRLTFQGPQAEGWLEAATTNHVARLTNGQIQYSLLANDYGGLIDDILVYRMHFGLLMVCNASNRIAVLDQLAKVLFAGKYDAISADRTHEVAMIAVQGPASAATLHAVAPNAADGLGYYHAKIIKLFGTVDTILSRTGYTGEDGFELMLPSEEAVRTWEALLAAGAPFGAKPCGLGARDTLRFEAAMPLYGHELSATTNPYAAGIGWAVKLRKGEFVGRAALEKFKKHPGATRVGLRLDSKRIARQGAEVFAGDSKVGEVTSGTFAPTLEQSLAMALVDPPHAAEGGMLEVDVRGRRERAIVVPLPFYKRPLAVE